MECITLLLPQAVYPDLCGYVILQMKLNMSLQSALRTLCMLTYGVYCLKWYHSTAAASRPDSYHQRGTPWTRKPTFIRVVQRHRGLDACTDVEFHVVGVRIVESRFRISVAFSGERRTDGGCCIPSVLGGTHGGYVFWTSGFCFW